MSLQRWSQRRADSEAFHLIVVAAIVANAALMGIETLPAARTNYAHLLLAGTTLLQAVFVCEITIRVLAARRVLDFFRDGWNVFDFAVVAVSLLPAIGPLAMVARVARILRVARLASSSPELRLIIGTMLRSIPSLGHVVLLLSLLLYVYALLGYHWFHESDPAHWGTLGTALLSLFQVLTLEGWPEMQRAVITSHPWSWVYFASFVVIAVFVVINLFIAVVINNLQTIKAEEPLGAASGAPVSNELLSSVAVLRQQLERLERSLRPVSSLDDAARVVGGSTQSSESMRR